MSRIKSMKAIDASWRCRLPDYVRDLAVSPEGDRLAVADAAGLISMLDISDGARLAQWRIHEQPITALQWTDQGLLVSSGEDGCAKITNPDLDGKVIGHIETDAIWVDDLAVCDKTQRFAICAGRRASVWTATGEFVFETERHQSTVSGVAFIAGTGLLVTAGYGAITIWDPDQAQEPRRWTWKGSLFKPHPSPDGQILASGCQDDSVHFWRLETGRDSQMSGYPAKPAHLDWSADSLLLATSAGHAVLVWSFADGGPEGTQPDVLQVNEAPISAMAFHPRAPLLLTGAEDGTLLLWEPGTDPTPMAMATMIGGVSTVSWLSDESHFVAGDDQGTVGLFRAPL